LCYNEPDDPVDPPEGALGFLVIVLEDEAMPIYTKYQATPGKEGMLHHRSGKAQWDIDLRYLREVEHELGGRINMVFIQPYLPLRPPAAVKPQYTTGGSLRDEPWPEEVLANYKVERIQDFDAGHPVPSTPETRAVFAEIYNNIIKKDGVFQYQCLGVFIDVSGSMKRITVEDIVDEFYWNLHQTTTKPDDYVKYLDPMPSCAGGSLSLGESNGCIYESGSATEQWLVECADASKALFEHPGGCTQNCLCSQGIPELCAAFGDATETPVTVTINCSFIIEGTAIYEVGDPMAAKTLECVETGVTHAQFVAEVLEALAVWKTALEYMASWVTVNFVNLGDETTTDIPSVQNYNTTYPLPQGNVGDFRFGMHGIDGSFGTIGHGFKPDVGSVLGSVGSVAGDFHFDSADRWRMDGTSVEPSFTSDNILAAVENITLPDGTTREVVLIADLTWATTGAVTPYWDANSRNQVFAANLYPENNPTAGNNNSTHVNVICLHDFQGTVSDGSRTGGYLGKCFKNSCQGGPNQALVKCLYESNTTFPDADGLRVLERVELNSSGSSTPTAEGYEAGTAKLAWIAGPRQPASDTDAENIKNWMALNSESRLVISYDYSSLPTNPPSQWNNWSAERYRDRRQECENVNTLLEKLGAKMRVSQYHIDAGVRLPEDGGAEHFNNGTWKSSKYLSNGELVSGGSHPIMNGRGALAYNVELLQYTNCTPQAGSSISINGPVDGITFGGITPITVAGSPAKVLMVAGSSSVGATASQAFSIKYVAVHEIGHVLGIVAPIINEVPDHPSHLSDPNSVMYFEVAASTDFDTKFPTGVVGSASDLAALKTIYCIE
jgi:hypothetical protein